MLTRQGTCPQGAAEACGVGAVTGRLEPGRSADMAAFKGNPVENIEAFTEPTFVMVSGYRSRRIRSLGRFN